MGYTLLSIEPILDGEYIDRNNGNVIFKPGRYMVKYKTAEGEEQEYKLLVENDPLLSIGVDGEKVGLDRIEERIFGKVGMAEIVKGTEVQMAFMKEEGSIIEKVVVKEVGKDKVGEILAEENRGIYKFNQEGERSIEIFVKLKEIEGERSIGKFNFVDKVEEEEVDEEKNKLTQKIWIIKEGEQEGTLFSEQMGVDQ